MEAGDVEPCVAGGRDCAARGVGRRPNFEPWCAVRIASCVSTSIPGVTRTSTRDAGRTRAVDLVLGVEDDEPHARERRRGELDLALVVAVDDDPVAGHAAAEREASSPSVETSAPSPSWARSWMTATFGKALTL